MRINERALLSDWNLLHRILMSIEKNCSGLLLTLSLILASTFVSFAADAESDWNSRIRALADQGHLEQALQTTENWMEAYPNDLDAKAWHARLQAWTNRWEAAENEYRELIEISPQEVDLLIGIADVLRWQKRYAEALSYLDQAIEVDADRVDCKIRRAQVLRQMGRTSESQIAYQEILDSNPDFDEAQTGLDLIHANSHQELRLYSNVDHLSYTDDAVSFGVSLQSQWNTRWNTIGSFHRYQRFGEGVTEIEAGITYKFSPRDALTVSGAVAGDNGIVPKAKTELEYSHGFNLSENGPVRGIETIYRQRWLWYRDTHLFVPSPTIILYLPGAWTWLFQYSPSRMVSTGDVQGWQSSGLTKLSFPIKGRTTGYVLFAKGTENFGYAEQIGQLSMQTWAGGMRFWLDYRQEIHGDVQYQRYSGERILLRVGVVYALHF